MDKEWIPPANGAALSYELVACDGLDFSALVQGLPSARGWAGLAVGVLLVVHAGLARLARFSGKCSFSRTGLWHAGCFGFSFEGRARTAFACP